MPRLSFLIPALLITACGSYELDLQIEGPVVVSFENDGRLFSEAGTCVAPGCKTLWPAGDEVVLLAAVDADHRVDNFGPGCHPDFLEHNQCRAFMDQDHAIRLVVRHAVEPVLAEEAHEEEVEEEEESEIPIPLEEEPPAEEDPPVEEAPPPDEETPPPASETCQHPIILSVWEQPPAGGPTMATTDAWGTGLIPSSSQAGVVVDNVSVAGMLFDFTLEYGAATTEADHFPAYWLDADVVAPCETAWVRVQHAGCPESQMAYASFMNVPEGGCN